MFSAGALESVLPFRHVLARLDPGLLEEHLVPLSTRIEQLWSHRSLGLAEAERRIRVLGLASRSVGASFRVVAAATLRRNRLRIDYHSRGRAELTHRTVSPRWRIRAHRMWPTRPALVRPIASTVAMQPAGIASIAAQVERGADRDSGVARSSRAGRTRSVGARRTARVAATANRRAPRSQTVPKPRLSGTVVGVAVQMPAKRVGGSAV